MTAMRIHHTAQTGNTSAKNMSGRKQQSHSPDDLVIVPNVEAVASEEEAQQSSNLEHQCHLSRSYIMILLVLIVAIIALVAALVVVLNPPQPEHEKSTQINESSVVLQTSPTPSTALNGSTTMPSTNEKSTQMNETSVVSPTSPTSSSAPSSLRTMPPTMRGAKSTFSPSPGVNIGANVSGITVQSTEASLQPFWYPGVNTDEDICLYGSDYPTWMVKYKDNFLFDNMDGCCHMHGCSGVTSHPTNDTSSTQNEICETELVRTWQHGYPSGCGAVSNVMIVGDTVVMATDGTDRALHFVSISDESVQFVAPISYEFTWGLPYDECELRSVALAATGDKMAVGVSTDLFDLGGVYVFEKNSTDGAWLNPVHLLPQIIDGGKMQIARSIDIDEDTLIVSDSYTGAYIFQRGELGWVEEATLTPSDPYMTEDLSTNFVTIKGNLAAL